MNHQPSPFTIHDPPMQPGSQGSHHLAAAWLASCCANIATYIDQPSPMTQLQRKPWRAAASNFHWNYSMYTYYLNLYKCRQTYTYIYNVHKSYEHICWYLWITTEQNYPQDWLYFLSASLSSGCCDCLISSACPVLLVVLLKDKILKRLACQDSNRRGNDKNQTTWGNWGRVHYYLPMS